MCSCLAGAYVSERAEPEQDLALPQSLGLSHLSKDCSQALAAVSGKGTRPRSAGSILLAPGLKAGRSQAPQPCQLSVTLSASSIRDPPSIGMHSKPKFCPRHRNPRGGLAVRGEPGEKGSDFPPVPAHSPHRTCIPPPLSGGETQLESPGGSPGWLGSLISKPRRVTTHPCHLWA